MEVFLMKIYNLPFSNQNEKIIHMIGAKLEKKWRLIRKTTSHMCKFR